mmetsp:Transcript_74614/g.242353  ORF Transcript_74614/g.242353 Transcript_74614/m.242353 type:complete len:329 (+) Transcript_74614:1372-2358(+)
MRNSLAPSGTASMNTGSGKQQANHSGSAQSFGSVEGHSTAARTIFRRLGSGRGSTGAAATTTAVATAAAASVASAARAAELRFGAATGVLGGSGKGWQVSRRSATRTSPALPDADLAEDAAEEAMLSARSTSGWRRPSSGSVPQHLMPYVFEPLECSLLMCLPSGPWWWSWPFPCRSRLSTPALSRARRGEAINLESAVDMLPPELSPKVSDRTGEISEYKPSATRSRPSSRARRCLRNLFGARPSKCAMVRSSNQPDTISPSGSKSATRNSTKPMASSFFVASQSTTTTRTIEKGEWIATDTLRFQVGCKDMMTLSSRFWHLNSSLT